MVLDGFGWGDGDDDDDDDFSLNMAKEGNKLETTAAELMNKLVALLHVPRRCWKDGC